MMKVHDIKYVKYLRKYLPYHIEMSAVLCIHSKYKLTLTYEQAKDWSVCWGFLEEQEEHDKDVEFPVQLYNSKHELIEFTDASFDLIMRIIQGEFDYFKENTSASTSVSVSSNDKSYDSFLSYVETHYKIQDVINVIMLVNFMDNRKIYDKLCLFIAKLIHGKSCEEIEDIFS